MNDRVCAERDCTTILSRFNPQNRCAPHSALETGYTDRLPWWAAAGNCASGGQLLQEFFPDEMRQVEPTEPVLAAKRRCADCIVRSDCLRWALEREDQNYRYGVFGMLTGPERLEIAKAQDPVAAGMELGEFQMARWPLLRKERSA